MFGTIHDEPFVITFHARRNKLLDALEDAKDKVEELSFGLFEADNDPKPDWVSPYE